MAFVLGVSSYYIVLWVSVGGSMKKARAVATSVHLEWTNGGGDEVCAQ